MTFSLTEEQQQIVESSEHSMLVIAGPGSGRINLITERFNYLIKNKEINKNRILIITNSNEFNKKLRKSINLKFYKEYKDFFEPIQIKTFYNFCSWIQEVFKKEYKQLNQEQIEQQALKIFEDLNLPPFKQEFEFLQKLKRIKRTERRNITENDIVKAVLESNYVNKKEEILKNYPLETIEKAVKQYSESLEQQNQWDTDDLAYSTYELLKSNSIIKKQISNFFEAIIIDEFQNIDAIQLEILKLLKTPKTYNLFIGDPDRSIFSFRETIPNIFERYKKQYPETQIYNLTTNFRCPQNIQAIANKIISKSPNVFRQKIKTNDEKKKGSITMKIFNNYHEEQEFVCNQIEESIKQPDIYFDDIAILYRSGRGTEKINHFEKLLNQKDIKFTNQKIIRQKHDSEKQKINIVVSWIIVFTGKNQKQIDAALKQLTIKILRDLNLKEKIKNYWKNDSLVSWEQILRKYFPKESQELLKTVDDGRKTWAHKQISLAEKINILFELCQIKNCFKKNELKKYKNAKELIKKEITKGGTLNEDHIVQTILSWNTQTQDAVFFDTIHQAKNLEKKCVFLIGWNKKNIPSIHSIRSKNEAEERRIAYVGITRVSEKLWITSSTGARHISPFLQEIMQTP